MKTDALLTRWLERTEEQLQDALPDPELAPQRLHQAMRYAALGGGKRMRLMLVYATGYLFGLAYAASFITYRIAVAMT